MISAEGVCPICGDWEETTESEGKYYSETDTVEFQCRCPHCQIEWTSVYGLKYNGFQIGDTWIDEDGGADYLIKQNGA